MFSGLQKQKIDVRKRSKLLPSIPAKCDYRAAAFVQIEISADLLGRDLTGPTNNQINDVTDSADDIGAGQAKPVTDADALCFYFQKTFESGNLCLARESLTDAMQGFVGVQQD